MFYFIVIALAMASSILIGYVIYKDNFSTHKFVSIDPRRVKCKVCNVEVDMLDFDACHNIDKCSKKENPPLHAEPDLEQSDLRCKFYDEETDDFVTYH